MTDVVWQLLEDTETSANDKLKYQWRSCNGKRFYDYFNSLEYKLCWVVHEDEMYLAIGNGKFFKLFYSDSINVKEIQYWMPVRKPKKVNMCVWWHNQGDLYYPKCIDSYYNKSYHIEYYYIDDFQYCPLCGKALILKEQNNDI